MKVEGQNFTIIRQEYMVLCKDIFEPYKLIDSSRVGAALLNYFESRANASYDGKTIQYEPATISYLNQCTMEIGSESTVKRCLNALVKTEYVLKGEAVGITKFGYDNTKKYCLNVNKLNEWLIKYRDSISLPIIQVATPKGHVTKPKVHVTFTPESREPNVTKDTKDKESIFIETPQTENHESDYVDFNNLNGTQKPKLLGQIKGLLQKEFNMFTFDKNDTFKINQAIYKVKDNLTAYNKSNGIFISVLDENVLEAFKTSMVIFKGKFKDSTNWSIPLFASCLNVNDYIKIDDTAKLLSLASDEIKQKYYKIAARDGKEIANEILRKVLKQHKI